MGAPLTVTTTSAEPAGRELGTGATILVSLQEDGEAATPAKVTTLPPCDVPKPDPLMVTGPPTGLTGPTEGDRLLITGADCDRAKTEMNESRMTARRRTRASISDPFKQSLTSSLKPDPYGLGSLRLAANLSELRRE